MLRMESNPVFTMIPIHLYILPVSPTDSEENSRYGSHVSVWHPAKATTVPHILVLLCQYTPNSFLKFFMLLVPVVTLGLLRDSLPVQRNPPSPSKTCPSLKSKPPCPRCCHWLQEPGIISPLFPLGLCVLQQGLLLIFYPQ